MGSHKPALSLPFDYKRRNKVVFFPMKTETHKKAIPKPVECLPDFGHFIPSSVSTRSKCQFLTEVSSGFLIQFHIVFFQNGKLERFANEIVTVGEN